MEGRPTLTIGEVTPETFEEVRDASAVAATRGYPDHDPALAVAHLHPLGVTRPRPSGASSRPAWGRDGRRGGVGPGRGGPCAGRTPPRRAARALAGPVP